MFSQDCGRQSSAPSLTPYIIPMRLSSKIPASSRAITAFCRDRSYATLDGGGRSFSRMPFSFLFSCVFVCFNWLQDNVLFAYYTPQAASPHKGSWGRGLSLHHGTVESHPQLDQSINQQDLWLLHAARILFEVLFQWPRIEDPPGIAFAIWWQQNIWHTSNYSNLQRYNKHGLLTKIDRQINSKIKTNMESLFFLILLSFLSSLFEPNIA